MGAQIEVDGLSISILPSPLSAADVQVPGDISSAAFWMVAAAVHPDAELCITDVGINPTRAGVLDALESMGANIALENVKEVAGEPVADIVARSSRLQGIEISGSIMPLLMDEVPVLAVAASMAEGTTTIRDAEELRVKETDRIEATIGWLRGAGIQCEGHPDGMSIEGAGRIAGGSFDSSDDHRLAMSLGVAGLVSDQPITIADAEVAGISYPGFWGRSTAWAELSDKPVMEQLNGDPNPLVVVISGPSGVGKDTLLERMSEMGFDYHFTVTATTRAPRPGEICGVNHFFLTRDRFLEMVDNSELLEWARVFGNFYGVPKEQVRQALTKGTHVLIRVDVQGARRLRTIVPEAVFIFVAPPSTESLRVRLLERGVNSAEDMDTRLRAADVEIREASMFDHVVVNEDNKQDEAVVKVREIIRRESMRCPPRRVKI